MSATRGSADDAHPQEVPPGRRPVGVGRAAPGPCRFPPTCPGCPVPCPGPFPPERGRPERGRRPHGRGGPPRGPLRPVRHHPAPAGGAPPRRGPRPRTGLRGELRPCRDLAPGPPGQAGDGAPGACGRLHGRPPRRLGGGGGTDAAPPPSPDPALHGLSVRRPGHRLKARRIRKGPDTAVLRAGLTCPGGGPIKVTPHQLCHTYATELANAGMSLKALWVAPSRPRSPLRRLSAILRPDSKRRSHRSRRAITWTSISEAFPSSRLTKDPRSNSCHLGRSGFPTTIWVTCWR